VSTMADLLTTGALAGLVSLTAMEIVLAIDNVVFLAILTARLPPAQQPLARRLGLTLALGIRVLLLFTITWVMSLTAPLFDVRGVAVSGRTLILVGGGLFLIAKATREIYEKVEGTPAAAAGRPRAAGAFILVLLQILLLDIVFSLDSVITAVGMAQQLWVMVVAVVLAVGVMLAFSGAVSAFVHRHPTIQMLALSFLILIGVMLVAEGIEKHIERGYIYFAMAFSLVVELLNLRLLPHGAPATSSLKKVSSP